MNPVNLRKTLCLSVVLAATAFSSKPADATIVEFQTVLGSFQVNLYDNATPTTVANFLNYVNNGAYTNSVYHRSDPGFVVQGGGFTYDQTLPLDSIPTNAPVGNEPEFSNVRGTIAMAKLANSPNSATSQWFFNLVDNSGTLDGSNGGFTVFGEVVGDGMDVVDAIAALPQFNFGAPANELPLRNYTVADFNNNVPIDGTNLVIVSAVIVADTTVDTAAGLNPPPNTTANPPTGGGGGGGGGGGNLGILGLGALLMAVCRRRIVRNR